MQKTPIFTMTVVATAVIAPLRFLGMLTGAHCAAGAKAQGVSTAPAAIGDAIGADVHGTTVVEAAGTFAAGVALKSDANGCAIAQGGTGEIVAYSVQACTAIGQRVEVLLTL